MRPVAALALAAAAACASARGGGGGGAESRLAREIERALDAPVLRHSGVALLVVSLDRGDTLFAHESDRLVTPASNLKLFTAASALHYLGPAYRFRTPLLAAGAIRGDTLFGDLVLVGSGDPDLDVDALAALADTVAERGVRVVAGGVRADASRFDEPADWGPGWMWDDGPYWYWPWISALTVHDNVVRVTVRPGRAPGAPVTVLLDPPSAYMELRSTAVTGEAGIESTLELRRQWMPRPANVIEVAGLLAADADSVTEELTMEDPALFAATLLAELLAERDVAVTGGARYGALQSGEPADTIAVHVSEPLRAAIRNFLKISDNLTGEQLVKTIAAEVAGPPGSYREGLAAERRFLASEVGLDTLAFNLADGSGVSRYNLVTTGGIVRLLGFMARREDLAAPWMDALPVAGVDGTLERRMRGTAAQGRARAKTGTLQGVSSISGYVPAADGERLAFSMIMEFFVGSESSRRAVQDSVVASLARFRR